MCKMPAVCFVVIQMHTHTHRRGTHVTHIATKLFQLDISYINVYTTTKFQHIIVIRHYHKMKIVDDYGDVWHIQADAKAVHEMQKSFEKCQEILDRPRRLFIKSIFLLQISTFFFCNLGISASYGQISVESQSSYSKGPLKDSGIWEHNWILFNFMESKKNFS